MAPVPLDIDADIRKQELAKLPELPACTTPPSAIVDALKLDRFLTINEYREHYYPPDIACYAPAVPNAPYVVIMNQTNAIQLEKLTAAAHGCFYTASSAFWLLTKNGDIKFHLFTAPDDLSLGMQLTYLGVYRGLNLKQKLSLFGWNRSLSCDDREEIINFRVCMAEGNYERQKDAGKTVDLPPTYDMIKERYDSGWFQLEMYVLQYMHWDNAFLDSISASRAQREVKRKPVPYHLLDEILAEEAENSTKH